MSWWVHGAPATEPEVEVRDDREPSAPPAEGTDAPAERVPDEGVSGE